jgi:hypothetical protein
MISGPTETGPEVVFVTAAATAPRTVQPAHQARHPVASTRLPGIAQVLLDTRAPHDAITVGMERTDLRR